MKGYGCSDLSVAMSYVMRNLTMLRPLSWRGRVYVCSCIFHLSFPRCHLCMCRSHLESGFPGSVVLVPVVGVILRWGLKYWKTETSCFLFEFMTHSLCEHSENAHFMPLSFGVIFYATMVTGTIISRSNFVYWRISFI